MKLRMSTLLSRKFCNKLSKRYKFAKVTFHNVQDFFSVFDEKTIEKGHNRGSVFVKSLYRFIDVLIHDIYNTEAKQFL